MSAQESLAALEEARSRLAGSPARARLRQLMEEGSFVELGAFCGGQEDPCTVVTGCGVIGGRAVYAFAQDPDCLGGALGRLEGEKIERLYRLAQQNGAPVVGIYDSAGAKTAQGVEALAAYSRLIGAASRLSGVVPQISVIAGCCLGSAAVLAGLADLVIMSETAEFSAGTSGQGDASAGAAAKTGLCHMTAADAGSAIELARQALLLLPANNLSCAPISDFADGEDAFTGEETPVQTVEKIADRQSLMPLLARMGGGVQVSLGSLCGITTLFAAVQGPLAAEGCAKLARCVSFCDCFQIPVVTVIDSEGFAPDAAGAREYAKLAAVYADSTAPKLALVTGEACGAVFLTLAGRGGSADWVLAWPDAVISALRPETAVAFTGGGEITAAVSRAEAVAHYAKTQASPFAAAAAGCLDEIIRPEETRLAVAKAMDFLADKRVDKMPKKHANLPL